MLAESQGGGFCARPEGGQMVDLTTLKLISMVRLGPSRTFVEHSVKVDTEQRGSETGEAYRGSG